MNSKFRVVMIKHLCDLLESFFGDIVDEDGRSYVEVYEYEICGAIQCLEGSIDGWLKYTHHKRLTFIAFRTLMFEAFRSIICHQINWEKYVKVSVRMVIDYNSYLENMEMIK